MAEAHLFSKKSSGWPAQLREMNKGSCHLGSSACRKCDWGKDALPFVCKVIRHVRELETKTEAWFRQLPAPVRSESQETSLSSESANGNGERYVTSDTDVSDQKFSSELCVQGVGLDQKDEQTTDLQKEVRAVLSEIIGLMEELKTECEKANDALKAERERVTMLGNKIDQLSLWWLHEFPEAVQKDIPAEADTKDLEMSHLLPVSFGQRKTSGLIVLISFTVTKSPCIEILMEGIEQYDMLLHGYFKVPPTACASNCSKCTAISLVYMRCLLMRESQQLKILSPRSGGDALDADKVTIKPLRIQFETVTWSYVQENTIDLSTVKLERPARTLLKAAFWKNKQEFSFSFI
ncbi:uncharacterized protein LOC132815218 [Hemiscyllium ocellatum]|uniref:uncharacterized protein LOC132815218 n=1 Tax=Hemiscyllium ocellatum TaxID=170820 RepID=UPI002966A139|nr:uncharacterized protein LOC132815218 [Hemiscyllium ocellatum]